MPHTKILAFALLLVAPAILKGQQGLPADVERNIVIAPNDNGECTVQVSPDIILDARPNQRIVWHVQNDCGEERTVGVDNFKHRPDNNRRKEPLQLDRFPSIPSGGSGQIVGRIKPLPPRERGRYKYDITIDGTVAEDPELEIAR